MSLLNVVNSQVYAQAALLGALSGMRSMAAPAAIARPPFIGPATLLLAAELVFDKLPLAPNRTAAGPLLGRALAGGIAAAMLCSSRKRSAVAGALIGAAAAVGAAYAAHKLRQQITRHLNIPDPLVALLEDAVVASASMAVTSKYA
jgi:uncharacterized membrane protein